MYNRYLTNPVRKYYVAEKKNITYYNVTNLPVLEIYNRQCLIIYAITFVCIKSPLNSKFNLLNITHYIFVIKMSLRKNKLRVTCVPETASSVALGQNIRQEHSGNE